MAGMNWKCNCPVAIHSFSFASFRKENVLPKLESTVLNKLIITILTRKIVKLEIGTHYL